MPICGLDMLEAIDGATSMDIQKACTEGQDASLAGGEA